MNCVRRIFLLAMLLAVGGITRAATVTSALPHFYTPGPSFTVTLTTAPDPTTVVQAIEDLPPTNWVVAAISHGGSFDTASGKIKWGPFTDALARTLSYQITPAVDASGQQTFSGSAVFDSATIPITGARVTTKFPGTFARSMPTDYVPGVNLNVTLTATPAADVRAWAAEELVPSGWTVSAISDGGFYDSTNHKIKWGPFFDANSRALHYTLTPPASARIDATLAGSVRFDDAILSETSPLPLRRSQFTRNAPATYVPATPFTVSLTATPAPYVTVLTVEETLPATLTPSNITGGGTWDPTNHKIKWGPFLAGDVTTKTFSYDLTPASGDTLPLNLSATAQFDDITIPSNATINRFLAHTSNTVVRTLPANYHPGQPFTITLDAAPIDTALVYAVEENIPPGFAVSAISSGGVFDTLNGRVKWGPFFDSVATARSLTFQLTPPTNAFGNIAFSGQGTFDADVVPTTGSLSIPNAPPTISRTLPSRYNPSQAFNVTVTTTPVPGIVTYAVEEIVPDGWTISAISDGGQFDGVNKKLKWGPFLDANLRPLTYTITPTANATGTNNFSGQGVFNGDTNLTTGATSIIQNHAPTLVADLLTRPLTTSFKLSVFELLKNDSDTDGDLLNVTSVAAASTAGGTIELIWPWIFYTAPAGSPAVDTFTYTVTDTFSATSTAIVTLTPTAPRDAASQNIVAIEPQTGGAVLIRFAGAPTFVYHIQISGDLTTWTPVADRTASSIGLFEYLDPDGSASTRFYRTLWP